MLVQDWIETYGEFVLRAFRLLVSDPSRFIEICENEGIVEGTEEKSVVAFTEGAFWKVCTHFNDTSTEVPPALCRLALQNLEKHFLGLFQHGYGGTAFCPHLDWIEQIIPDIGGFAFGYRSFLRSHKVAIALIEATDKNGDLSNGTGVLLGKSDEALSIITNTHVLAGAARINTTLGGYQAEVIDILHVKDMDISVIKIKPDSQFAPLRVKIAHLLDEVIVAGYPAVSGTMEPVLVFGHGYVCGEVETYHSKSKLKLISANVAPGNSGGPVFNDVGEVVGIITEEIIGKYKSEGPIGNELEISKFAAMIPIEAIALKDPSTCGALPIFWGRIREEQ